MRDVDFARLNEPYPEGLEPPASGGVAALGMELPQLTALERDILADFEGQPHYGIGWWAPGPGTSRRILIADQLYCCLASVAQNMAEGALHWLEFLDASDRDSARFADAVKIENRRLTIAAPLPRSPLEQLSPEFVRIHYTGMVRALASALDCLAGVIIGVVALPMSILRADFDRARKRLSRITGALNEGGKMQAQFAARLEINIAVAGPAGWLDWTLGFRNMLVHRGRRLEYGQLVPRSPILYGADAQRLLRARRVTHLPRDPDRSDVEVFLDTPWTLMLGEDGQRTLKGLIGSTKALIESTARDLLDFWRWRRDQPSRLPQPAARNAIDPSKGKHYNALTTEGFFLREPSELYWDRSAVSSEDRRSPESGSPGFSPAVLSTHSKFRSSGKSEPSHELPRARNASGRTQPPAQHPVSSGVSQSQ